jgi:hypothetical protein
MSARPPVAPWVTTLCIVATLAALIFNVVWDALQTTYEGSPVTFGWLRVCGSSGSV